MLPPLATEDWHHYTLSKTGPTLQHNHELVKMQALFLPTTFLNYVH